MRRKRKSSLKRKILFLMATALDETIEWWEVLTSPYLLIKGAGFKVDTFRKAVNDLSKIGFLEKKVKRDGQIVYRLSRGGMIKIIEEIPLARFIKKPWDKKWRVVVFDIPEKEKVVREALRRKLVELGFGMLQRSVWITPHDLFEILNDFLTTYGLASYALIIEGEKLGGEDDRQLARRVWKLNKLSQGYLDFVKKWEEVLKSGERLNEEIENWRNEYFSLLEKDPGLPKELLPKDWPYKKACEIFEKLEARVRKK